MKRILLSARIEYLDHAWKYFVNESYLLALRAYPVECLCPLQIHDYEHLAQTSDALLLCGGYDIAPYYFHERLDKQAHYYDRPVDAYDFALLDAFVKTKKPILGICRGLQIINVYFGGTLHQHFDVTNHEESAHHHRIVSNQDSIFAQLLPHETIVNSYHHQCIKQLGAHLQIGAQAKDGCIEAIQHETLPILGVQWHPEKMECDPILPYFVHLLTYADAI